MTVELGVQEENQRPVCISTHYLMTVELGVQEENQQPACISTHYLHNIKLYQVVYLTKEISNSHALVVSSTKHTGKCMIDLIDFWCLMPLSAIFQLYHGHLL
jgi:hypothetical protein